MVLRGDAGMFLEDTAQMTVPDAKPVGKLFDRSGFKGAFFDQPYRTGNGGVNPGTGR